MRRARRDKLSMKALGIGSRALCTRGTTLSHGKPRGRSRSFAG
jgi:hypothetical protein